MGSLLVLRLISLEVFCAQISNPLNGKNEKLGRYCSADAAHHAWLDRKTEFAQILAKECTDSVVADALVRRYENYPKFGFKNCSVDQMLNYDGHIPWPTLCEAEQKIVDANYERLRKACEEDEDK